jgi:hypothetical protein
MSPSLRYLIAGCIFLLLLGTVSIGAAPEGFLEGHLKIISHRPVQLADENAATETDAAAASNYSNFPLTILSRGERKEIMRISANEDGYYRAALPPGDYILDAAGRVSRRLRVKAQPFTVVPNRTVRVDITIDTGFASE